MSPSIQLQDQYCISETQAMSDFPFKELPKAYVWPEEERPCCSYEEEEEEEGGGGGEREREEAGEDIEIAERSRRQRSGRRRKREDVEEDDGKITEIPVVDLSQGWDSPSVVRAVARACREWGLFYVVNHGVPARLVDAAQSAAARLFALPPDAKARAARREGSFLGFGRALVGRFFRSLMWSEGFTMDLTSISPLSSSLFPSPCPQQHEFKSTFEEYELTLRNLSTKLLGVMLKGVNVDLKEFESTQFSLKDCNGTIQLNHYPPCPQPMMTIGLAPHTDSTCLTIVHQGVAGLETCKGGRWKLVPPLKDSFVVHVGDMVQILSNDMYKSPLHRALVNRRKARFSIAYLFTPPTTRTIYPTHEAINSSLQQSPLYKPLNWLDYIQAKKKHFTSAIEHFKYK